MKLELDFKKKHLYLLILVIVVLGIGMLVGAYNPDFDGTTGDPPVLGHSADEMMVKVPDSSGDIKTLQEAIDASDLSVWTVSDSNISYIDGNVGIGTSTLTEKLTIDGNIDLTNQGGVDSYIYGPENEDLIFYAKPNAASEGIRFNVNSLEAMTIREDGNIGIGTYDPTDTLTVDNVIRLIPRYASDPVPTCNGDHEGALYYDFPEAELKVCIGGSWEDVGGGDVTQTLSINDHTIALSGGGGSVIVPDNVNDNDADPNNEKPLAGSGISVNGRTVSANCNAILGHACGYDTDTNTWRSCESVTGHACGYDSNSDYCSDGTCGSLRISGSNHVWVGPTAYSAHRLSVDGSAYFSGLIGGPCGAVGPVLGADGACLKGRKGHQISLGWYSDSQFRMYVDGIHVKSFIIDHPQDPKKYLIHTTLECPEVGVYYRGESKLIDGKIVVALPSYFEALTKKEGRSVLLTPKFFMDEPISMLAASEVKSGKFTVRAISNKNPGQEFYWEVKAERKDVEDIIVEPAKDDVVVKGSAPTSIMM